MYLRLLPLIGLASTLALPDVAEASSCCGTGPGVIDRLHAAEGAAISLSLAGDELVGAWDRDGIHAGATGAAHQLRLDASGLYRVAGPFSIGARVPLVVSSRSAGELEESGGGIGDVAASGRWDLVAPGGEGVWPGIGLGLSVLAPTGSTGSGLLLADATGGGAWELQPGLSVEQSWFDGWSVTGVGSLAMRLPTDKVDGARTLRVLLAGGRDLLPLLSFSAGALYERTFADEAPGSARSAVVALLHRTLPGGWSLTASGEVDLPVARMGFNDTTGVTLGVGLRRAWILE